MQFGLQQRHQRPGSEGLSGAGFADKSYRFSSPNYERNVSDQLMAPAFFPVIDGEPVDFE